LGGGRVMKLMLIFLLFTLSAYSIDDKYKPQINKFIELVKNGKWEEVAEDIQFPIQRDYPIKNIESKKEFLKRRHELFDKKLIKMIIESDLDSDWAQVGWRGIMFDRGKIWFHDDGTLYRVNYSTELEYKRSRFLLDSMRKKLHPSLKNFEHLVFEWKTKNYLIRNDRLLGDYYRISIWEKGVSQNSKPLYIFKKVKKEYDGNGGNHYYEYKDENTELLCRVNYLRSLKSPPGRLKLIIDGKTVIDEDVIETSSE
jgi:hypothetical protein